MAEGEPLPFGDDADDLGVGAEVDRNACTQAVGSRVTGSIAIHDLAVRFSHTITSSLVESRWFSSSSLRPVAPRRRVTLCKWSA